MISDERKIWLDASHRYRDRGGAGSFEMVARQELKMAGALYDRFCTNRSGVTLDLGAGSGGIWNFAIPPEKLIALDYASHIAPSQTYNHRITGSALHLPLKSGSIRTVVALGLLEYLQDLDATFREWARVCQPGARLLLTNSPPNLPNVVRKVFGYHAIPRPDAEVVSALGRQDWSVFPESRKTSGWQSLMVAEAVILQRDT